MSIDKNRYDSTILITRCLSLNILFEYEHHTLISMWRQHRFVLLNPSRIMWFWIGIFLVKNKNPSQFSVGELSLLLLGHIWDIWQRGVCVGNQTPQTEIWVVRWNPQPGTWLRDEFMVERIWIMWVYFWKEISNKIRIHIYIYPGKGHWVETSVWGRIIFFRC